MKQIYLEPNQVPEALRYSGKKYSVVIGETMTLQSTYWSGGTRSTYRVVELTSGKQERIAGNGAPDCFGIDLNGQGITLKPGYAVVEHSIFCGKDGGLTFYIHPDNAGKFLTHDDQELSRAELCLLDATGGLKASYAGRKPRIEMMRVNGFGDSDIATARDSLIRKKLLRKNGSITPAGMNARPPHHQFKQW
jgi:hypothetical protein